MLVKNDILGYKNREIFQDDECFSFSLDSVMLANFATIRLRDKNILDLGTGNGVIPLILSLRTNKHIDGVEIQEYLADMAKKSVELNKLTNQINIYNVDMKNFVTSDTIENYDLIVCNPPYFKCTDTSLKNDNDIKSIARHEIMIELEDVIKIAKKLLKNGGSLCMVHRTDRLIEIIETMRKHNIEPKRLQFIYPKNDIESNLILIDGKKNGNVGLKVLAPLYVHNDDGSYTDEVLKIFGK